MRAPSVPPCSVPPCSLLLVSLFSCVRCVAWLCRSLSLSHPLRNGSGASLAAFHSRPRAAQRVTTSEQRGGKEKTTHQTERKSGADEGAGCAAQVDALRGRCRRRGYETIQPPSSVGGGARAEGSAVSGGRAAAAAVEAGWVAPSTGVVGWDRRAGLTNGKAVTGVAFRASIAPPAAAAAAASCCSFISCSML